MSAPDIRTFSRPPDWTQAGLCAQIDPDTWFPEMGGRNRDAKKICRRCPVRIECLEYALANHERHGVWGGLSTDERKALLRSRRHSQPAPGPRTAEVRRLTIGYGDARIADRPAHHGDQAGAA